MVIFNKWIGQSLICWPKSPSKSPKNQHTIVINFHQDFIANIHYDFFKGKADWGLNYWPNNFA
jgi:hypothetical protein